MYYCTYYKTGIYFLLKLTRYAFSYNVTTENFKIGWTFFKLGSLKNYQI